MPLTGRRERNADMKLFEHPDFEQLVLRTDEYFRPRGLRAAIIEKDYYVTETLRMIAASKDRVIFKGGTSLSKGWNLIERFSEDVDIFLDPQAFNPELSKRGIDRELKALRDTVTKHPALTFMREESQTIGGFGRNDRFAYQQRFGGVGEVGNRVLLEAGAASGREPTEEISLRSYLSEFLTAQGISLGADDEDAFPMRLLHFRRTFVEKLFAIHGKVELLKRDGRPIGAYARHYYDLFKLSDQEAVITMLKSDEYAAIKVDYDKVSREHFPENYLYPDEMKFANSEALFPPRELAVALERDYEAQCKQLCYGPYPPWAEVLGRFDGLRGLL